MSEGRYPRYRSHYLPRSVRGWVAVAAFLLLMVLAQPPIVHGVVNRVEPFFLGVPFLYGYLSIIYFALIGVLLWAHRQGL